MKMPPKYHPTDETLSDLPQYLQRYAKLLFRSDEANKALQAVNYSDDPERHAALEIEKYDSLGNVQGYEKDMADCLLFMIRQCVKHRKERLTLLLTDLVGVEELIEMIEQKAKPL